MKKIGLYANLSKQDAMRHVEHAALFLHQRGSECCAEPHVVEQCSQEVRALLEPISLEEFDRFAEVVISFGGDGTMLSAARTLVQTDIPIMGVNLGKLGFLAEFSVEDVDSALSDVLSGNYRVVDRTCLETTIGNTTWYALNEIMIEKRDSSRMIKVATYVDEHHVADYRADGILLTTPTGSTAYSLSCGGPIITPSASVLCLTPISPHALTLRPLVVPDTNEITFKLIDGSNVAGIVADGAEIGTLNHGDSIVVRKSECAVKLLKRADSTYFDLLRTKLLWSVSAGT